MGVFRFNSSWMNQYIAKTYRGIFRAPQIKTSIYAIDMNSLLHKVAALIYGYLSDKAGENRIRQIEDKILRLRLDPSLNTEEKINEAVQRELFEEYIQALLQELDKRLYQYQPQEYFIMAIDGGPPFPKIVQQRTRRYRNKPHRFFNTVNITPGTQWMMDVDAKIREWVSIQVKRKGYCRNFVYSPFTVKGEGEHKMMDMFRNGSVSVNEGGSVIIEGADSDLNMLAVQCPFKNVFIMKEDNFGVKFTDIDFFRECLIKEGRFTYNPQPDKILFQDFIFITFFIGNDFVPNIFQFHEVGDALNLMFSQIYQTLGLPLTDINGQILWDNFDAFIKMILSYEDNLILEIIQKTYERPFTIVNESIVGEGDDAYFDPDLFRKKWYSRAILPRTEGGMKLMNYLKIDTTISEEEIEKMTTNYLQALQWILQYYLFGGVIYDFNYPYQYAPLLGDLISPYLNKSDITVYSVRAPIKSIHNRPEVFIIDGKEVREVREKDDRNKYLLNLQQQMLCVFPPSAFNLVTPQVESLLEFPGELSYLAPEKFQTELEGYRNKDEHHALVFVPPVYPDIISGYLKRVPKQFKEESDIYLSRRGAVYESRVPRQMYKKR